MLHIAVCDDEELSRKNTEQKIRAWSEKSGIDSAVFLFDNGDDLLAKSHLVRFDILFLDILMPLLSGMDTARELRRRNTAVKIIFLTASPEFALESYDVRAQGYLLKPASYEKVAALLDDCAGALREDPPHLAVKTSFGYQTLYFHDMEYAEAQNKRVIFYLRDGRTVESVEPLHTLEDKFTDHQGFFKCHRSYLVYLPGVDHFSSTEIIMRSGRRVPIARGYARPFKEAYFARMFRD